MNCFNDRYRGSKVLVTGHTGFKGAWLSEWLLMLGAEVTGLALPPQTSPSLFDQLGLSARMDHRIADVRDQDAVRQIVDSVKPDFVFHLAAQPLVRYSYDNPVETFATNVLGTVNLLEAMRPVCKPCTVIAVTTDKCYENREWLHSYREEDPMGGYDPYSASKGAAELVISSYRRSYFSTASTQVRLASARAGNVIGGGDWAQDRLIPDCIRALSAGKPIPVRSNHATRPWQHVLEPLSGYLWLAAKIANRSAPTFESERLDSPFNFGPNLTSNRSVEEIVREVLHHWPGEMEDRSDPNALHEASRLNLSIDKAFHLLGWKPVWDFAETVSQTVYWYRNHAEHLQPDYLTITRNQIVDYVQRATDAKLSWVDL